MDRMTVARDKVASTYSAVEAACQQLEAPPAGADVSTLRDTFDEAFTAHEAAKGDVARFERTAAARALTTPPASSSGVSVTSEPVTYAKGNHERSIFRDMVRARGGDHAASERLARHTTEMAATRAGTEQFALSSTDAAGGFLVPPGYLQTEFAALARAGRPTVEAIGTKALPPGTDTLNIPVASTGTTVAIQADNTAVSSTDMTFASVQADVKTIAGMQDVARQVVDRATPGTDEVIFGDLARAYSQKFDSDVVNSVTANYLGLLQVAGTTTITYTDATPTLPELYLPLTKALNAIAVGIFMPADLWLMHPRRWNWMLAALDTQNRPLVVPAAGGENTIAMPDGTAAQGAVGTLLGLPVIVDASIPVTLGAGTEDAIIAVRRAECYIWEDASAPWLQIFEDVLSGSLGVRFRAHGYVAQMHGRRPLGIAKVTGTGLIAP